MSATLILPQDEEETRVKVVLNGGGLTFFQDTTASHQQDVVRLTEKQWALLLELLGLGKKEPKAPAEKWVHRVFRVEYVVRIVEIDQYERETGGVLYEKAFPSYTAALVHLNQITTPHPHVESRLIWKDAPHSFHSCRVTERQIFVEASEK